MSQVEGFRAEETQIEEQTAEKLNAENESVALPKKATKKGVKKDADARGRILAIALKAFADRGFDGVSTTELAKAAGVTQPLIHYHFKSKKALWQTVVRNSFAVLNEEFIQPMHRSTDLSMTEVAEKAINDFVRFVAARTEFVQILLSESTQDTARLQWMVEELLEPCMHDLSTAYADGVRSGVLVEMPMAQLISLVLGASSQFFVMGSLNQALFNVDVCESSHAQLHIQAAVKMLKKALIITAS